MSARFVYDADPTCGLECQSLQSNVTQNCLQMPLKRSTIGSSAVDCRWRSTFCWHIFFRSLFTSGTEMYSHPIDSKSGCRGNIMRLRKESGFQDIAECNTSLSVTPRMKAILAACRFQKMTVRSTTGFLIERFENGACPNVLDCVVRLAANGMARKREEHGLRHSEGQTRAETQSKRKDRNSRGPRPPSDCPSAASNKRLPEYPESPSPRSPSPLISRQIPTKYQMIRVVRNSGL